MIDQSFDIYFDRTFRSRHLLDTSPIIDYCRPTGYFLQWLTIEAGWDYHLFSGKASIGADNKSRFQTKQGGVRKSSKVITPSLVVRTFNLTKQEAKRVSVIYGSSSVYLQLANENNKLAFVPVFVDDTGVTIWSDGQGRQNLEVTLLLPEIQAQRI